MSKPFLPNQAMINAVLGGNVPPKMANAGPALPSSILQALRVVDEQDHINKYTWRSLPIELSGRFIERVIYYRGQGAFFYVADMGRFYFLPFVGAGLDVEGRYKKVTPLPFVGSTTDQDDKTIKPFIKGRTWRPVYSPILPEDLKASDLDECCVIIGDYTRQLPQKIIPRANLNEPLLQLLSECLPLARTALINNTGVGGIRINSEDEQPAVTAAASAVVRAAINGDRWVGLPGDVNMVELNGRGAGQVQDYLLAMQSFDNLRLSLHGLDNGGLFQKKSHMLEAEQRVNDGTASLIYQDGLHNRQDASTIINSIWGTGTWCDPSEAVLGIDKDLDGDLVDDQPGDPTETIAEEAIEYVN